MRKEYKININSGYVLACKDYGLYSTRKLNQGIYYTKGLTSETKIYNSLNNIQKQKLKLIKDTGNKDIEIIDLAIPHLREYIKTRYI